MLLPNFRARKKLLLCSNPHIIIYIYIKRNVCDVSVIWLVIEEGAQFKYQIFQKKSKNEEMQYEEKIFLFD